MEIVLPDILNIEPSSSNKLSLQKFTQYFDKVMNETNKDNTCVLYSHFISDYYITIDFTTFKYIIPNHINDRLNECKTKRNIYYYIIPIILKLNENHSHANVLIVDNLKKTIELYEPHGNKFSSNDPNLQFDYEYHIKNLIKIILHRRINFIFKNVHNKCPIGLQTKQVKSSKDSGHCVAWILFFIHTRMLNLKKDSEEIINYFDKFNSEKLDLYIRKYTGLIELETIKKQNKYIKDSNIDFTLNNKEINYIKTIITKNINEYLSSLDSNYRSVSFYNDIKNIFNKFIIYSKFEFFDELYFKTIQSYFKNKKH